MPFRSTPEIADTAARAFLTLLDAAGRPPAGVLLSRAGRVDQATRRVVDAAGQLVDVPAHPRRVFAHDDFTTLPMLLALGVPVVATTTEHNPPRFPSFLTRLDTSGIKVVGRFAEFSVERLAALSPDLILARPGDLDDLAPTLRRIAPVAAVPLAEHTDDWPGNLRALAGVVGRSGRAGELLVALGREIDATARRLAAITSQRPTVSLARIGAGGEVRTCGADQFPASLLARLGFTCPDRRGPTAGDRPGNPPSTGTGAPPGLDADIILYFPTSACGDTAWSRYAIGTLTHSPAWSRLPAVRAGRAFEIDPDPVSAEGGVQQVRALLAELERILLT